MAKREIAFVGSVGCGKTVLLTVLTHRFQHPSKDGRQICPANQDATNFCVHKWDDLRDGKFPAPTPPAENPPVLRWKLRRGHRKMQLVTSDIAGEAWRSFVISSVDAASETILKSPWESVKQQWAELESSLSQDSVNNHITTVENLLKTASGVFLLLDLGQIINREHDYDTAMFLPTALVEHMKNIGRGHVPIILVLTKVDKYKYENEKERDWRKVVERYVPWAPLFDRIIPVAAVADTKMKHRSDGSLVSCPAPEFASMGIEDLYENIWDTMAGSWRNELKHKLIRFCKIDVPVLVCLTLGYLWLYYSVDTALICWIYLVLAFGGYIGIKSLKYMRSRK